LKSKNFYKDYNIRFAGINYGRHTFDFVVNDAFMKFYDEGFENAINLKLKFAIEKQSETFYSLFFEFNGSLICNCDRCLNQIILPLNNLFKMFLKVVSENTETDDDDIAYVSPLEFEYNIADNIHDYILLMIPLIVHCEMAEMSCNQEMIDKLNNLSANDKSIGDSLFRLNKNFN